MAYEVEAKIQLPVDSVDDIQQFLMYNGFTLIIQGTEEDWYFNHPCRDFAKTDEALRIRKKMNQMAYSLTYKGKKLFSETKTREELITEIQEPQALQKILEALGFHFVAKVTKHRSLYKKNQIVITLDNVPKLGFYMEFEKEVTDPKKLNKENQSLKEYITAFLRQLTKNETLTPSFINESYLEMLLDKGITDNSR